MYILSFDIEEWYTEKVYWGDHQEQYNVYDSKLNTILDILDEKGIHATFFCVGGMASFFPGVLKRIASRGHEIGCHSYKHEWLNTMTDSEVYEDTRVSVDAIEQCLGCKVKSYRAPAFSIGEKNKNVFEILSQCGIERDASIFPASRDFGGFSNFDCNCPIMIEYKQTHIKEFPICTTKFLGKKIAYSGGGYFRFFPIRFVIREISKSEYVMTYFHISDLVPEIHGFLSRQDFENYFKIPGTLMNRGLRYIKSNIGMRGAFAKLQTLISAENFLSIDEADNLIDWNKGPIVSL